MPHRPDPPPAGPGPLLDCTCDGVAEMISRMGERPYRAAQLLNWIYQRRELDPERMSDLPAAFRRRLEDAGAWSGLPRLFRREQDDDGTAKLGFRLQDGGVVETVLIPAGNRYTLCLSSQLGCALGCSFCRTGGMGLMRNLTPSEIVGQALAAVGEIGEGRLSNVVFMGMGEPLRNYPAVRTAVLNLTDVRGFGLSRRHVTVSTAGLPSGILAMAADRLPAGLAVSLNATDNETRTRLMPLSRRHPLDELLPALDEYRRQTRRSIFLEYVLLSGVNDSDRQAAELGRIARGLAAKVNLIPHNPFPGSPFSRPADERVLAFQKIVMRGGTLTFVRRGYGRSILAACGMLASGGEGSAGSTG